MSTAGMRNSMRRLSRLLPWNGNFIQKKELDGTLLVPWGFLSQSQVCQFVLPPRMEMLTRKFEPQDDQEFHSQTFLYGDHRTNPELEAMHQQLVTDFSEGGQQAYIRVTDLFTDGADFLMHDCTSPDLSMFLGDVLQSYRDRSLRPSLHVHNVDAKLLSLRMEYGLVSKNRYLFGLMSKREAWYHILSGAVGPESTMLSENNGEGPRRLVAEVEYTCDEDFSFQDRQNGQTLYKSHMTDAKHYWTFESDYSPDLAELDWCITNMNDVIKPALSCHLDESSHLDEKEDRKD